MPDVRTVYEKLVAALSESELVEAPEFEAKLILCRFVGGEPRELPLKYAITLSDSDAAEAYGIAEKRVAGEPLQYLLGQWEFMSLPFFVGRGVFIPSPDTEHLATVGIDFVKTLEKARLLDLCAGSGCVGISVAQYCENVTADLVELYPEAFAYLEKNLYLAEGRCRAINADALTFRSPEKYDVILSNPPYVTADEYAQLPADVTAQPKTALTDGGDGLKFYRKLTKNAFSLLREGGMLAFEIGYKQYEPVSEMMFSAGFKHIHPVRDYAGLRRVVIGYR
ncbi:MAG: peptide chain release factor N(5)-glutamine methyltransferase [Clostridia bacterium]|nr:peptide chain release factor N(5)-glutamine methyltransferase [Clostridia bacterium]